MKETKFLLFIILALISIRLNAQETTESDLVGKWNLTKVEVLNMQGETELSRQTFDALSIDSGKANFGHVVEIDQIECSADRKTIYRGQDKGSPFIRNGNIQISVQTPLFTVIHFHNGFWSDVNFVWIDKPTSFMLISEQLIDQAYDYREQVWLYYTKE
jgi:hypothetical protein